MAALPTSLLKDFAKITNDRETSDKSINAYGVTIKTGETVYVKLDGTEELTPVSVSTDAQDGDRVLVAIEKHTATVIGNITCPASARTATNFMKLTEDGLIVGQLDKSGNPVGTYSLIAPGIYYIMGENGATLASFSANEIKLGGGMAVFSTDKITLGNGMAVFTTDKITLGNGMATFTTDKITLGNGVAVFSTSGINLGEGKLKIEAGKITLGTNGEGVFTPDKVTLAGGAASFSADEISLANGMAIINPTKVSLGNNMAVFTTDKVTLGNGVAVFGLDEISLANGKAVFGADRISLANGMAVFTGESITLGTNMAVISTTEISLANGKAKFTESKISLLDQAIIEPTQITLGGTTAKITTTQISLANEKAIFSGDHISLDDGSVYIDSNGIKLGKAATSVINLCNGSGSILVNEGVMVLKGATAAGLLASYDTWRSEVVAKCDSAGTHTAAMQVYDKNNAAQTASIVINPASGIKMTVPNGLVTINDHELLHSYNMITDGSVKAKGSLAAKKRLKFSYDLTSKIPDGYHLAGIRQITTNYPKKSCISGFSTNPSTKKIGVSIHNLTDEDLTDMEVNMEWFAFRAWNTLTNGETVVDWNSDSVE